ncbi:hypothetical protein [Faecalibacter bovis]|uniref:DinB family protein n=1 Tax=Faecalibacter bovis TaxID=2898187 RepID=A0ABX7XE42_9FLAO|nr:hypothetical protein [Faecalibacter bovis]QTV06160.1 hypothetical protein J9309_02125 [Faecalibacter bovis]
MQIKESIHQSLSQLENILIQLNDTEYTQAIEILNGQTIGKHVRHIVEFFQCLLIADDVVCFDNRKREVLIENSTIYTLDRIKSIKQKIEFLDFNQPIILRQLIADDVIEVQSTIGRELIYCIDHSIHHFAIIKMVLRSDFPYISISEDFGIAYSTLNYTK